MFKKPFSYKQEYVYYASLEYAWCKYEISATSLKLPWCQQVEIEKFLKMNNNFTKVPTFDIIETCSKS